MKLQTTIPLPEVRGRIDHMDYDNRGWRIFVAALGSNTVEVTGLSSEVPVRTLTGFDEPQGVLFLTRQNELIVTNGGGGAISILDGSSLKHVKTLERFSDADNIRYDPAADRVYVGYGEGGIAVVNPGTNALDATIPLSAHPEAFVVDGKRIYVNTPGNGRIEIVEGANGNSIRHWNTIRAEENFPMSIDPVHHRLFIGFRDPPSIQVLDTSSGKRVAQTAIHGDVDDLFFDPSRSKLYASCGEGFIDVLSVSIDGDLNAIESIRTRKGARTSLLIAEQSLYVVAVPRSDGQSAELRLYALPPQK